MNDNLKWYDLLDLTIEGRGFEDIDSPYDRLPAKAKTLVSKPIWDLSLDSAGMCARFVSDARALKVCWVLRKESLAMAHMPATGVSGVDLYVRDSGHWRWLAIGQPTTRKTIAELYTNVGPIPREYVLYLPLYNGVESVSLGVPMSSDLKPAPTRTQKAIVFYGTSITQGGCASRPGSCYTAFLGRWMERPVINLGFSGNGKMEQVMAELMAEIDAALYVIDCLPNMTDTLITERASEFVRVLRFARPEVPILLVEDRTYANNFFDRNRAEVNRTNRKAFRQIYSDLKKGGVEGVHYLNGSTLLGEDGEDTVDGSHPTDLGFIRIAKAFLPKIEQILSGK